MAETHRIVIIGAGPGGICAGYKLKAAGFDDFVMLERAAGPGGTWHNNRYPGLACDVPSVLYSFSFAQKPDWSRPYGTQAELKAYMAECVERFGLEPHIRYGTEVRAARWDDSRTAWRIETGDGGEIDCDILVSALGMFNEIQYPDIPGLEGFGGVTIHTADWPEDAALEGKRVAVVGTAASAVQLIPEVAKEAGHLTIYQRTANWVFPKEDKPFTAAEIAAMRADPSIMAKARADTFEFINTLLLFQDPAAGAELRRMSAEGLAGVADPETRAKLEPKVPLGAQRPLFSNEYYPTFNRPNVTLVADPIERVTASGIRSADGTEREIDVLILATGYAANKYLSVIDVTGRGGRTLAETWADGAHAYRGITVSGFPNLFMCYGPNTNNGSILTMLELQIDYIVSRLKDMEAGGLAWIDVRQSAMDRYNEGLQAKMRTVDAWKPIGTRYYRAASGRIVTQWPGTMVDFAAMLADETLDAFEAASAKGRAVA